MYVKKSLTLGLLNSDIPAFANSVDPDHLASEEASYNLDLHCLSLIMPIYIKNLEQVI